MGSLMIDVCKEYGVSPKQVFFILIFFAAVFIIIGYSRKNPNKSVKDINFLSEKTLMEIVGVT